MLFAEVEEVNSFGADFYADDFSRDALGFADVLAGFVDGDAVGGLEQWGEQEDQNRDREPYPDDSRGARCRALPGWTAESLP